MKLQVQGYDVYVKFHHGDDIMGRFTEVTIQSDHAEPGFGLTFPDGGIRGITWCHPRDQYSRKKGRLQALNSAFYGKTKPVDGADKTLRKVSRNFTTPFLEQYFLKQPKDRG